MMNLLTLQTNVNCGTIHTKEWEKSEDLLSQYFIYAIHVLTLDKNRNDLNPVLKNATK